MDLKLQELCNNFINYRDMLKKIGWESNITYCSSALIFLENNINVNIEKILSCKEILNDNTGLFSNFRSLSKLPVISMMALSDNPELKLQRSLKMYDALKGHFWGNQYLALASMAIIDFVDESDYEQVASKAKEIYNSMKENHPFLTSKDDLVHCALLAVSDKNIDEILDKSEEYYGKLKSHFFSANSVQALTHVLSLQDGDVDAKVSQVTDLFHALKKEGYRYGTTYELPTLALLLDIDVDYNDFLINFKNVDNFLSNQKGFGFFGGISTKLRYMYVAMILLCYYIPISNKSINAINISISILIAQQAAMAGAAATTAAMHASH